MFVKVNMLAISSARKYFLFNNDTDMRKGFDSLSGIVRSSSQNPLSGDIFIFLNRRRNQVKLLLWEGDGFGLYYKRLEKGTYEVPAREKSLKCITLTSQQLNLILEGISLQSVRKRKRFVLEK